MKIKVGQVKNLLSQGKIVKVKSLQGQYTTITNYIEKGNLDTFLITTDSHSIKVSNDHLFFSRCNGWIKTRHIKVGQSILCEDQKYQKVLKKEFIGKEKIVDITVDHHQHCYYGNGILNHNSGKSWVLCNLATHAIKTGKKVIYYSLEMTEQEIGSRVDSMLCKKPVQYIEMKANWDKVKKLIEPYRDNLRIKQFLPNMTKVGDIQNHMNQLVLFQKFDPDLIIVDYGDILKKESSLNDLYTAYGDAYINLKRLAKQYRKAVWTASQGNRCLTLDTVVDLKGKGKTNISCVQKDDRILTPSGYKRVIEVCKPELQPVYQIKLKNGTTIKCSANHLFPSSYGTLKSIESGLQSGDKLFFKKSL